MSARGGFLRRARGALRRPEWRHGGRSLALLCLFLAACVLLNLAVQALEDEYGWRIDYSFNGYATTGAETEKALSRLTRDVELYLLYQSGEMDSQLKLVLDRYAVLCDRVRVRPTDIARDPGVLTAFSNNGLSVPEADTVVVNCPDTGRYKLLTYADFTTVSYNVDTGAYESSGLSYEKKLTEAIVYVAQDEIPVVGILQGHGELDLTALSTLTDLLESNSYDSRAVALSGDSTSGALSGNDSLSGVDLLLIASPQKDLGAHELERVDAFLKAGGSLLVTRDFTDPISGLPNYFSLLRSYGVVPRAGVMVASEQDGGSYYGEPLYLLPYMRLTDLTRPLLEGGMDVLLMPGACAFETPSATDASLTVEPVLVSGPNAYLRDFSDGLSSTDKRPGDPTGEMTLALNARRAHADGTLSRVFAVGCSALFTDSFVYQSSYAEAFILRVMNELVPQRTVDLDIMASTAFHPGIRPDSRPLGVALCVLTPLMTLLAAALVLLPRRNR